MKDHDVCYNEHVSAATDAITQRAAALPTKVDIQCDKLVMVAIRTKLTTIAIADVLWKFLKSRVWVKVPDGTTLIFGHTQIFSKYSVG